MWYIFHFSSMCVPGVSLAHTMQSSWALKSLPWNGGFSTPAWMEPPNQRKSQRRRGRTWEKWLGRAKKREKKCENYLSKSIQHLKNIQENLVFYVQAWGVLVCIHHIALVSVRDALLEDTILSSQGCNEKQSIKQTNNQFRRIRNSQSLEDMQAL